MGNLPCMMKGVLVVALLVAAAQGVNVQQEQEVFELLQDEVAPAASKQLDALNTKLKNQRAKIEKEEANLEQKQKKLETEVPRVEKKAKNEAAALKKKAAEK